MQARLRIAQLEVEGAAPGVLVRVGEHLDVFQAHAAEAQAFAVGGVEVGLVEFQRELFGGRDAVLDLGAQVEAAVAGVVTGAQVLAEATGDELLELVFPRLQGFRDVGVAEGILAAEGGRGGEKGKQGGRGEAHGAFLSRGSRFSRRF